MGFKNNFSPLRYPGGKAAITDFFADILSANNISNNGTYCEPFAGGAGVALTLLLSGRIGHIVLNDFDKCIASFWYSVINNTDEMIKLILNTPISIEEWARQREIYESSKTVDLDDPYFKLKIGFSTFYLNRCNRAGILPKAGPIGGKLQNGKYKINARFKKDKLIERIKKISTRKNNIVFTSMDAQIFLDMLPELSKTPNDTFLYLDPPYFHKGDKLYLNFYNYENHIDLANKIYSFDFCPWIMTYDDCPEIKTIYREKPGIDIAKIPIQYSMQKVRTASEILIIPTMTQRPAND